MYKKTFHPKSICICDFVRHYQIDFYRNYSSHFSSFKISKEIFQNTHRQSQPKGFLVPLFSPPQYWVTTFASDFGWCSGLIRAPQKDMSKFWTNSGTCKCDLIWERVFADVIKDLWNEISLDLWWTLNPMIGVLREKRGRFDTQRHSEKVMWRWKQKLERCIDKPNNTEDCQQPPEAGRGVWDRFSLGASRRNQPRWHPWF